MNKIKKMFLLKILYTKVSTILTFSYHTFKVLGILHHYTGPRFKVSSERLDNH